MISRRWLPLMLAAGLFFAPDVFAQGRALKKVQVGVPAISMGNIIIYFAKEATSGGRDYSGGGCGCN